MRVLKLLVLFFLTALGVTAQTTDTTWQIKGTANLSINTYNVNGIENRREPLRYTLSLRPVLTKGSWSIPIELNAYNIGIGSDYKFLRFGIHPTWRWGKIHLGHTNMRLSSFSISGRTLLGAGVELNPGLLRFAAFAGTTKQATNSFISNAAQTNVYAQQIFTTKIGFGNRAHFLDIIVLKGKDDASSVDSAKIHGDVYPEENVVIAARTEHYFFKKKIHIGGEYAISGLTTNQNSSPIDDSDLNFINWLWEPKTASFQANAFEAFVAYRSKQFNVKLAYQRIGPGYRSMGAYFFQNDLESYDASTSFKFLKNKFRVKLKGGVMRNNLADDRTFQSIRMRGFVNVLYTISKKVMLTANYSNYQTEQILQDYKSRDSLRSAIVSNNLNATVQIILSQKVKLKRTLRINGGMFNSVNRQDFNRGVSDSKTYNGGVYYQVINKQWQWQLGLTYLGFDRGVSMQNRYGNQVEISRSLKGAKWKISINSSQVWTFNDAEQTVVSWLPSASAMYRPNAADSFMLRAVFANYVYKSNFGSSFNELQASFRYAHRFGAKK